MAAAGGFDEKAAIGQEAHVAVRMSGRNRLVEPDDVVNSNAAEGSRNSSLVEMRIAREQTAPGRRRKTRAVGDEGAALADERQSDNRHAEVVLLDNYYLPGDLEQFG
jgi:hypothetical protein